MKSKFAAVFVSTLMFLMCSINIAAAELNIYQLSKEDTARVKALIKKLEPFIHQRDKTKDLARLTFDELYAPLNSQEQAFLKSFQNLKAKDLGVKIPFRQFATGKEDLIVIVKQMVKVRDHQKENTKKDYRELAPQFLPRNVYAKYKVMADAMRKDLGKRLLIESGYRSSAYQLYLVVYYLQNHKYSMKETVKYVAMPGYSEHGAPAFQAIDFINEDGINGEDNPSEFDVLPEFDWLMKNAKKYGFVLSYPKNAGNGITYEPWHWRYEERILTDKVFPGIYKGQKGRVDGY